MTISKSIFALVVTLIALQVVVSITGAVYITAPDNSGNIVDGVKVGQVDLSGLTKTEAELKLTRAVEPGFSDLKIIIKHEDRKWSVKYSELGVKPDFATVVEEAYLLGREPNPLVRALNGFRLRRQGEELQLKYVADRTKITSFIDELTRDVDRPYRNAALNFRANKLEIIPESKGTRVKVKDSVDSLTQAILEGRDSCELKVEAVTPEITSEELNSVKGTLSIAVTPLEGKNSNRLHNIKLAAQSLNHTLIKPGEELSFNEVVGERTKDRGFKDAPVISNTDLATGVGGGVCQVSTTLYQAAVLAGLEIVERHPHSLPPDYTPLGQDAAVADGQLDLRLRNKQQSVILLVTYIENDRLFVRIMGGEEATKNERLVSEVIEEIQPKVIVRKDARLAKGASEVIAKGAQGYRVKVFLETASGSGPAERKLVSEDLYRSKETILRLGTKESRAKGRK